jgi:hypothetical protein
MTAQPFPFEPDPASGQNALALRVTIEQVCDFHNRAIVKYAEAHTAIARADAAFKEAHELLRHACFGKAGVNNYSYEQAGEVKRFLEVIQPLPHDEFMRTAKKLAAVMVWAGLIEHTELERLMDKEAKDKLRQQMRYVPEPARGRRELITDQEIDRGLPPITPENIYATLETFRRDAGQIFRRGVANVFSALDRRFRSHGGFKLGTYGKGKYGGRVVLTHAIDSWGNLRSGGTADTIADIERTFAVLDGDPGGGGSYALASAIRSEGDRCGLHCPFQFLIETQYFLVRGYKNQSLHLWFKRKDLIEKVNQILAEWYGEVLGDAMTDPSRGRKRDPFADIEHRLPAKYFGFYPSPAPVVEEIINALPLHRAEGQPLLRILEPSAGTGNIARELGKERWPDYRYEWSDEARERVRIPIGQPYRHLVDCVEIQPCYADQLQAQKLYRRVWCADFLKMTPKETGLYDVIAMNPPFDLERDTDHVMHALKFLADDGVLVAVVSAGLEFRQSRKAMAFRALMERMKAQWRDLPAGSFADQGTNVNTMLLRVKKDGSPWNWDGHWSLVKANPED